MNALLWCFLSLIVFALQTHLTPFNIPLNLSIVLIFIYSLGNIPAKPHVKGYWSGAGEIKSSLFGAIIGMIEDGLSGSIIGPYMMSKSLAGFAFSCIFTDVFFKYTPLTGALILALLTAADYLLMVSIRLLLTDININIALIIETSLIQSLVNIPIGFIMLKMKKEQAL